MWRAAFLFLACVGCASTAGGVDAATSDAVLADTSSADAGAFDAASVIEAGAPDAAFMIEAGAPDAASMIEAGAPDAGCGALVAPPTAASTACPSGEQCPECTGVALVDGLDDLTATEVYASACGSFGARGALRLAGGTIEWVTELSHYMGPVFETDRARATYTAEGHTLHLASLCYASTSDFSFGTSAAGRLELRATVGTNTSASVYQRRP